MAASWRPLVCLIVDSSLSDDPPKRQQQLRARSYETGFKVFRHRNPPRSRCKAFHGLRKIRFIFRRSAFTRTNGLNASWPGQLLWLKHTRGARIRAFLSLLKFLIPFDFALVIELGMRARCDRRTQAIHARRPLGRTQSSHPFSKKP